MTKNKIFTEIKLAMKAGHYRDLSKKEKKIYKNAFKNGYKLAKIHCKKKDPESYKPRRIISYSFAKPNTRIIDSIINRICIRYEVHKKSLMGKVRTQDIVRARNIIHNILYENIT